MVYHLIWEASSGSIENERESKKEKVQMKPSIIAVLQKYVILT